MRLLLYSWQAEPNSFYSINPRYQNATAVNRQATIHSKMFNMSETRATPNSPNHLASGGASSSGDIATTFYPPITIKRISRISHQEEDRVFFSRGKMPPHPFTPRHDCSPTGGNVDFSGGGQREPGRHSQKHPRRSSSADLCKSHPTRR